MYIIIAIILFIIINRWVPKRINYKYTFTTKPNTLSIKGNGNELSNNILTIASYSLFVLCILAFFGKDNIWFYLLLASFISAFIYTIYSLKKNFVKEDKTLFDFDKKTITIGTRTITFEQVLFIKIERILKHKHLPYYIFNLDTEDEHVFFAEYTDVHLVMKLNKKMFELTGWKTHYKLPKTMLFDRFELEYDYLRDLKM
jgi:hypothetical protein